MMPYAAAFCVRGLWSETHHTSQRDRGVTESGVRLLHNRDEMIPIGSSSVVTGDL
jgi:hypothetical protein